MAGLKDKAGELLGLLFNSQNPEVSAPKPESGVALQDVTGKNSTIYQRIVAGEQFFEQWDLLICPPAMTTAFPHCEPGSPIPIDGPATT